MEQIRMGETSRMEPNLDTARPRVVRTLAQSPRIAREQFWLDGDFRGDPGREPWWDPADVVAVRALDAELALPLLLWEDVVGSEAEIGSLLAAYFGGNTEVETPEPEAVQLDARESPPLPDDEFWPVIDQMNSSSSERAVNRTVTALAGWDDELIRRWARTASDKALALLTVLDGNGWDASVDEMGWAHALGAVIARGKLVYEEILEHPTHLQSKWLTDHSWYLFWSAERALSRKHKREVEVITGFRELFYPRNEALRARAAGLPPITELNLDEETKAYLASIGLEVSELLAPAAYEPDIRVGRALVLRDGQVVMRIVADDIPLGDTAFFLGRAIESFGGALRSPLEVNPVGYAKLMNTDMFTIKRSFSGSREDYCARYIK